MYMVYKNNQQVGPYTHEHIHDFVKQSVLEKDDLCWKEGWIEWRPIASILSINNQPPMLTSESEVEIYRGSPSLVPVWLSGAFWIFILSGLYSLGALFNNVTVQIAIVLSVLLIAALNIGWKIIKTKSTHYFISSSRIKITSGILNKQIEEIELHRIQDLSLNQEFIYRLFNLGSINIVSVDRTDPIVVIKLIENSENIREKLRTAVSIRRKKEHIREVQMF